MRRREFLSVVGGAAAAWPPAAHAQQTAMPVVGFLYAGSEATAKAATETIPIVFSTGVDPVEAGLVGSLNRPGGNVTGVNYMQAELATKQLGLLHELLPRATRFAALINPDNPFGTLKTRMGATHFLMKTLPKVATEMALQVLAYNMTRVMSIMGVRPLMAAMRA
jgi:ABC-type uncharacterized transport system substrate-binding protein